LFGWEISGSAFLRVLVCEVLLERRVEFRGEEGEEQIEKVYPKRVTD
jgi:hypothetical protein